MTACAPAAETQEPSAEATQSEEATQSAEASASAEASEAAQTRTITDHAGNEVVLPESSRSFSDYQCIRVEDLEQYPVSRLVHAFLEKYI